MRRFLLLAHSRLLGLVFGRDAMGCRSLQALSRAAAAGLPMTATKAYAQRSGSAAPPCDFYDAPLEKGGVNYPSFVGDVVGVTGLALACVDEHRLVQPVEITPKTPPLIKHNSLHGTAYFVDVLSRFFGEKV